MGRIKFKRLPVIAGVMGVAMTLAACAVKPVPLTEEENTARSDDLKAALAGQEKLTKPLTLYEALARALRYNLSTRIKEVERQITENRSAASVWAMFPKTIASGGQMARSNVAASSSRSVTTGLESLETSTSQESTHTDGDIKMSWNILDFGVSYFTSRQLANQTLIAEERRKKVIQQLVNDVREAYWKAVAAERLLSRSEEALDRVRHAIGKAEKLEESEAQKPVEMLAYQRDLYSKLLQLQGLRRTLVASKLDLAKMMNLPPTASFKLVVPEKFPETPPVKVDVEKLEEQALARRPELIEESLQGRIAADEVRKSIARMFPGIELSGSANYTSNKYLLHNQWGEAGLKLSWNLINLLSGWDDIEQAEMQEQLSVLRRRTLGMAVITQVNLAHMDFREAELAFNTASRIQNINEQIEKHKRNEADSASLGEMELIQMQLNTLLSQNKKDEQYAQLQGALGRLVMSTGENPLAGIDDRLDIDGLSKAIEAQEQAWQAGEWFTGNKTPPLAAPQSDKNSASASPVLLP